MQLGADADALDRMAACLAAAASRLGRARRSLDASVGSTLGVAWTGPDARRFAQQWRTVSGRCGSAASALDAAAAVVRAQAAEQRRASRAEGVGAAAPRLDPPPRRIRVATLSADVSLGPVWAVGGREEWRLEDLVGGRVRVSELHTDTAGVQAGRGATVDIGLAGPAVAVGSGAQVALMAGLGSGRSWTVAADQVDDLLARRAAGLVLGVDLLPAPDADRRVLGVDLGAAAAVALGQGHAAAGVGVGGSVSSGHDRRAGTTEVAVGSSSAASLAAVFGSHRMLDASVDATATATLTLAGDGTPVRLDLVTGAVVPGRRGDEVVRRRVAVDLTGPQVRVPAAVLARELSRRPPGGRGVRRAAIAVADAAADAATVTVERYRATPPVVLDLSVPAGSVSARIDDYRLVADG